MKDAIPHPKSLTRLLDSVQKKVRGTIMEIDSVLPKLTEVFDPTHEDAEPGSRVRDIYMSRIRFDEQPMDKEKSASLQKQ